jgi:hypothetical protein
VQTFSTFFSVRQYAGDALPDKMVEALAECYWPVYPDWKGLKVREIEGRERSESEFKRI